MAIDFLMQRRAVQVQYIDEVVEVTAFSRFFLSGSEGGIFSPATELIHLVRGETVLPPRRTPKTHFHVRVKGWQLLDLQIVFSRIFAASKLWVFSPGSVQSA